MTNGHYLDDNLFDQHVQVAMIYSGGDRETILQTAADMRESYKYITLDLNLVNYVRKLAGAKVASMYMDEVVAKNDKLTDLEIEALDLRAKVQGSGEPIRVQIDTIDDALKRIEQG